MSLWFEAPFGLALGAVIGPLLWLYLRLRRKPPVSVSSLFLWRAISQAALARRRLRLPLLFYIQAALIVAFAAALARPFSLAAAPAGPLRDVAIVVDQSASMQALEGGETRFSAAQREAQALAREVGSSQGIRTAHRPRGITVIGAALHPRVLGTALSGTQSAQLIGSLQPLDTNANLTAALELAAGQVGEGGTVHLFSDTTLAALVVSRAAQAATQVHAFGTSDDNLAIVGLKVVDNGFDAPERTRILATVKNFSNRARSGALEVRSVRSHAGLATTGDPPLGDVFEDQSSVMVRREVALEPRVATVMSLEGAIGPGIFELRLTPEDALGLDNRVFGFVSVHQPLKVSLVTDDGAFGREFEELARRLGRVSLTVVAPAAYRSAEPGDVTLFDRFVPPLPPPGNVAYLAPGRGNGDVSIVGTTSDTRFAEVREHELLAGVENPETLLAGGLVGLASGGSLKPVLIGRAESREAALVLAGTPGGRRVVATAFGLRRKHLRDADALPQLIFTLNLIRWLSPASSDAPIERLTGDTLRARFPDATAISEIEGSSGTRTLGPTDEIVLERAGLFRALGGGRSRALVVNFIDQAESDIGRAQAVGVPQPAPRLEEEPVAPRWIHTPQIRWVLLSIVALMLAEWLAVGVSLAARSRSVDA